MAIGLLAHVFPDSVVALQGPTGSGVLALEIDEGTEHGPDLRAKLDRYEDGLRARSGWHVLFVVGGPERVAFLVRVARRAGGYRGLAGRAWALGLGELRRAGLAASVASLGPVGGHASLGAILADPRPRRCPTPVGTAAWLQLLGTGGAEETDEALR